MEEWSEGQLALFDALGKVCERFGNQAAGGKYPLLLTSSFAANTAYYIDLAKSISTSSVGKLYYKELEFLRGRSAQVDDLQKENSRLKTELESTARALEAEKKVKSLRKNHVTDPGSEIKEPCADAEREEAYDVLLAKHQVVKNHLRETESARGVLEERLRKKTNLARQWMEYSDGLKKKNNKLKALVEAHGVPVDDAQRSNMLPLHTPNSAISSPLRQAAIFKREFRSRRSISNFTTSHEDSELDGDTVVGISADEEAIDLSNPIDDQSKPKKVTHPLNEISVSRNESQRLHSSQSNYSSATQSEPDGSSHRNVQSRPEHQSYEIKEESPDTPIVVSCRAVKKNKSGMGSVSHRDIPRVKVEILSSSPVGLAGLLGVNESMDLDDIGGKVDTPKKKRQILKKKSFQNINRSLQAPESGSQRPLGNPVALQIMNTNLQVTPRNYGGRKRRRLNQHGASMFSEDGEHENVVESVQDLKLGFKRLSGLLEVSPPKSPVLIPRAHLPEKANNLSTRKSRPQTSPNPLYDFVVERNGKSSATKVSVEQKLAGVSSGLDSELQFKLPAIVTPNEATFTRNHANGIGNKTSMRHSRSPSAERDHPDDEPFRARPVRRLGLEHFKVNSHTNQGYDFAFSDVVRGREQRKCLPGCTKPECCGETFRKLAELSMWEQNTPTSSQEERNDRLLKDYLGDNATKLRNINEGERKELLIQAKAREISNKHGKHRHAYERRKSPPGFWRTDFPSTQEQENDRTEAAHRERELVRNRYEEAMRPGGAWMFRDE